LIELSGGKKKFVQRLDAFFDVPGRYDVGNEPGFLSPYLYICAGRHASRWAADDEPPSSHGIIQ
jgi:putative alpha-1,2-mannosidase